MSEEQRLENDTGGEGSNWVTTVVVTVIIVGGLAVIGLQSFNKVRTTSRPKSVTNNLRQLASAADQFFIETGQTIARSEDIIGTDLYLKTMPAVTAGERYDLLFPIRAGFTQLEVSRADGTTVRYTQ